MAFDSHRFAVKVIDAAVYAVVLTGVAFVVGALVSAAAGGGLPGAKWFMFFAGFAMFGYASLKLRPKAAWKDGGSTDDTDGADGGLFSGGDEPVGIERAVGDALDAVLPPTLRPTPDERPSSGTKLFLGSVCILAASFLMEVALGINY